jgi:hypothetical protein
MDLPTASSAIGLKSMVARAFSLLRRPLLRARFHTDSYLPLRIQPQRTAKAMGKLSRHGRHSGVDNGSVSCSYYVADFARTTNLRLG